MAVILDTDIGSDIDDAMALLLCLRLPGLSLRAITAVYGQVELRAKIAKRLIDLSSVEVPVAAGESVPISSPMSTWHTGAEGMGLLAPDEFEAPCETFGILRDGVVLLIRVVSESRDPVEIVAIGPLTNVARAIERDPRFRTKICRIWAMIGGITYPNAPPTRPLAAGESFIARASHNIRCDVGATRIVLESGIPVVMVGNDVTTRVWFHESDIERVERVGGALNRAVMSLMRVWLAYRSRCFRRPITKTCLHDALVVAEAHGMGFTERDAVDVKVFDDGGTRVTANPDSHIEVCRTVDAEAFERWYIESVTMNRAELPDTRREWRRTGHKEQT